MISTAFGKAELNINDLLDGDISLASPPEIYARLSRILKEPDPPHSLLAEVIERDPALSARVLKLANSAFFALAEEVGNIEQAINLIGIPSTRDIVLATEVIQRFNNIPHELVDIYSYWHASLRSAILAHQMAMLEQKPQYDRSMFLAGLLHDVGHLVIYMRTPELGRKTLLEHRHRGIPLHIVERNILGFDYAAVGAALAHKWNLPKMLCSLLASHLEPQEAQEYRRESALINIATTLGHQGSFDEDLIDPLLPPELPVWELAGIDSSALKSILPAARQDFEAALHLVH